MGDIDILVYSINLVLHAVPCNFVVFFSRCLFIRLDEALAIKQFLLTFLRDEAVNNHSTLILTNFSDTSASTFLKTTLATPQNFYSPFQLALPRGAGTASGDGFLRFDPVVAVSGNIKFGLFNLLIPSIVN